jgi:hypothetical protein
MSVDQVNRPSRTRRILRDALILVSIVVSSVVSCWLIGTAATSLSGNRNAPWIVGRAAGITSYLLLVALVALGLVLSHPWRSRVRRPSTTTRIRAHVTLSVFALAFTVLHVVVLATDSYAGVGIFGSLVPMGSTYRPVPVTLGVVGLYAGLLAGLTAAMAGRLIGRVWWPIHKVAAVSLVLVWGHGILAGSDSPALMTLYIASGALVTALAVSRYVARTPSDLVDDLTSEPVAAAAYSRTERALESRTGVRR